jgi:iron complex transport system substrate-binding protein
VVSLHDVTSEIVVALGGAPRLVGVSEPMAPRVAWHAAIAATPRVGGLEAIVALRPTLVLGLAVVAEQDAELVAGLRAAGVEVVLYAPATLADVAAMVDDLGARLGRATVAAAVAAPLRTAPASPPGRRPRVLVYDCCDPPFTAGGRAVLSDLIARAGGANVFADLDDDWTHVSWEVATARRPELVVVHDYAWPGQADLAGKRAALARAGLGDVPVVVLPLTLSLGGLGSGEALARLRAAIARQGGGGS